MLNTIGEQIELLGYGYSDTSEFESVVEYWLDRFEPIEDEI